MTNILKQNTLTRASQEQTVTMHYVRASLVTYTQSCTSPVPCLAWKHSVDSSHQLKSFHESISLIAVNCIVLSCETAYVGFRWYSIVCAIQCIYRTYIVLCLIWYDMTWYIYIYLIIRGKIHAIKVSDIEQLYHYSMVI